MMHPPPPPMEPRMLPNDVDAEAALLGSILIDHYAILDTAGIVEPNDFYLGSHGTIYAAMQYLQRHGAIDTLTVISRLRATNKLEEVGGEAAIMRLTDAVPWSGNCEQYAKDVAEAATRRRLIRAAGEIATIGYDGDKSPDTAVSVLTDALHTSQTVDGESITSVVDSLIEAFEEGLQTPRMHMPLGMTESIARGGMVVIGARPNTGKTVVLTEWALSAARAGESVLIVSYEMSADMLSQRLISQMSNVPVKAVRGEQQMTDEQRGAYYKAAAQLRDLDIRIVDDRYCPNLDQLERIVERQTLRTGTAPLVIIDYLGLIPAKGSRYEATTEISRRLKQIASKFNGVVVASQLNRNLLQRPDHRPTLGDLRDSGGVEQDADAVYGLYRDDLPENTGEIATTEPNVMEVSCLKARADRAGNVYKFAWLGDCVSIKPLAWEAYQL